MRDSEPRFEWTPGHAIEDAQDENLGEMLVMCPEAPLIEEIVTEDEAVQLKVEEEQNMSINDNEEVIDGNYDEENECLILLPEDNAVSDDEIFIENEVDATDDVGAVAQMNQAEEEVTAADVDDAPVLNDRPRRINTVKVIERLHVDFQGK